MSSPLETTTRSPWERASQRIKVRFACIYAPETSQSPYGMEPRRSLQELLPTGSDITLRTKQWTTTGGALLRCLRVALTPQTGIEQAGRRLALVTSPKAYNAKAGLTLFCPVTSRVKGYPFEVALPEESVVSGVVLADQLKSVGWRARKAKLIKAASPDVLAMVASRILPLLIPDNAATL